jgi:hypothetical protein
VKGATQHEIARATRHFSKLKPRERDEVMQILRVDYDIVLIKRSTGAMAYAVPVETFDAD